MRRRMERGARAVGIGQLCVAGALISGLGCAGAAPCPEPQQALTTPAPSGSAAVEGKPMAFPGDESGPYDLVIDVRPEQTPKAIVRVRVAARGLPRSEALWRAGSKLSFADKPLARPWGEKPEKNVAADTEDRGANTWATTRGCPQAGSGAAACSGTTDVEMSYSVIAEVPSHLDPPRVAVDPDRMEVNLEGLLLLPEGSWDKPVRALLRVDTAQVGGGDLQDAASSFGVGASRAVTARGRDLAQAFVIAGRLGQMRIDAPEGHDEAAWLGYTSFDPRPAVADMAGLRTALAQTFRAPDAERLTFLFLADSRPTGTFLVARHPRSIVVRVGLAEGWTAPLRISVATDVIHGWIGSLLWVGPDDPAHEAEAYWFSEGVPRYLARDLLFRFGLITDGENIGEAERLASVLATSPLRNADNVTLAQRPKGAVPVIVARGATYAARVDAVARKRSKGKMTLLLLLRGLFEQAKSKQGPLPASAWTDMLGAELDDVEKKAYDANIVQGKPIDLPEQALGPCFRRVTRTFVGYDAGFDEARSQREKKVIGVVKGGPADRAGLKDGQAIKSIAYALGRPNVSVEIDVEGKPHISFLPQGDRGKGPGWERKTDVPDSKCAE